MAATVSNGLYSPEVWEDVAQAEFLKKAIVINAAIQNDALVGKPGDEVDFPKWSTLSDLDDLTEGVAMGTEALTQSSTKATIKEAGKAVEITDTAKLVGLGNAQDEAIRQFGVLAARKVDGDLITVAGATVTGGVTYANGSTATDSAPLSFTTAAGGLKWAGIVGGIEKFGDDFEPDEFSGLYVRSDTRAALWNDPQFIAASQAQGVNGVVNRGLLGNIGGLNVYVTDRLSAGKAMIIKRNALGVLYKRRPIVEQDRDILKRTTVVTTNLHYAVKRLNDRGVCVLNITA
ncbi:MAG: N4-gp56 family major capsid protein [Renibacterium salmoninarum]|nr:N4-gp56 family major capsid protein [Renibacterium salmoninarum]